MNVQTRWLAAVLVTVLHANHVRSTDVEFSRDIRAVLSDKCFLCHGPDEENRRGDLRLDIRDSAIDAGVLSPGKADASEVIARITSTDPDVVMPPPSTGKAVTADEIEHFKKWIADGAHYDQHWAFVPPSRPELPQVSNPSWCLTPIDFFVLHRLDREKLSPAKPADEATLIRRLHLDLIGLPPSPQQIDTWSRSEEPDAISRLVDELLRSKHFGERWARWWLDAARYSDSDGYEKDKQREVWFYRDWVTSAMNSDMPYDEFIVQQIAGDLLPGAGQAERVATGFLRNSMVNEEGGADPEQFRIEGMFDRMDAIGKAILGITTQCAQCHTHKYDPLTHEDYYRMFAALNDFHEAIVTVYTPDELNERQAILDKISAAEDELQQHLPNWESQTQEWLATVAHQPQWTTMVAEELPFEGQKFRLLDDGSILSESYAPTKMDNSFPCVVQPGTITAVRLDALTHPQLPHGGPGRSIDGTGALTEFEISAAPQSDPSKKTVLEIASAVADVNPDRSMLPSAYRERDADKDTRVTGGIEMAIDGDHQTAWTTDNGPGRRNQDRHAVFTLKSPLIVTEPTILTVRMVMKHGGWNSDDNQNYLIGRYKFSVTDHPSPVDGFVPREIEDLVQHSWNELDPVDQKKVFGYWRTTRDDFESVNRDIEKWWSAHPVGTSQLAVQARTKPRQTFVMLRGDFLKRGDQVTPGAPEFLHPFPPTDEPDRLRLARWMVDDQSPTTARAIVNRIWQAYFGRGLVTTPEDLGFQSPPPSHPELLDWLAVELMENDWSLQHIHRLIVRSAVYRQCSEVTPAMLERDRYNELLARGARFRVDAELVRDSALAISGLLCDRIGGPSVYPPAPSFLFEPPASYGPKIWKTDQGDDQYRRSLYVHSYRSTAYPPTQVFDAPKGDAACVRRERSNTPLQALVMLNEPQLVECARAMAQRILREAPLPDDESRIRYAHRLATGREPDDTELSILTRTVSQQRERVAAGEVEIESLVGVAPSLFKQLTGEAASDTVPWIVLSRVLLNLDETITKD